jgi:hypothetical protein
MLISKIGYLANGVSTADFRPTTQAVEVQGILKAQLAGHLADIEKALAEGLPPLNAQLSAKGLPAVVDRRPARITP